MPFGTFFQFPFVAGVPILPARRMIAVDAGVHTLKVVVIQVILGRIRCIQAATFPAETLTLNPSEWLKFLESLGPHPIALCLPQSMASSQWLAPLSTQADSIENLLAEKGAQLSGLTESPILSSHGQLQEFPPNPPSFWANFCREEEAYQQINRALLAGHLLADLTTAGNALLTAFRIAHPTIRHALLVDIGHSQTTLVQIHNGIGIFTNSLSKGSQFLSPSPFPSSPSPDTIPAHSILPDGPPSKLMEWAQEIRTLALRHSPIPPPFEDPTYPLFYSGGGSQIEGLMTSLQPAFNQTLSPWPSERPETSAPSIPPEFAIAWGASLHALSFSPQPASLLPPDLKVQWKESRQKRRLLSLACFLTFWCALLLLTAFWQKSALLDMKEDLLQEAIISLENSQASSSLALKLTHQFALMSPVAQDFANTLTTLDFFRTLQTLKTNDTFFYVLLADRDSYFSLPPITTNETNSTTTLGDTNLLESLRFTLPPVIQPVDRNQTEYVLQVCIPPQESNQRLLLSSLVRDLNQQPNFLNLDLLPESLERPMVQTNVLIPNGHFTLIMEPRPFPLSDWIIPISSASAHGVPSTTPPIRTTNDTFQSKVQKIYPTP